ncbi:uncharacterized protein [Pyrus communis]|uniref:uncharacterized protein n=1 Tax=Pyrus communis TaxID=23211 RepID=UPI0035BFFCAC
MSDLVNVKYCRAPTKLLYNEGLLYGFLSSDFYVIGNNGDCCSVIDSTISDCVLISSVSSSVNVKLDESNYLGWHFQMELLLEGHSIIGFVDGSMPCPAQFCHESSGDSATKVQSNDYKKIKEARDLLSAAGVFFDDDDIIIITLNGLPAEFNIIRSMIRGHETVISLKDLRSQLLAEETLVETIPPSLVLSALMAQTNGLPSKNQSFSNSGGNCASSNSNAYKSFNQNGKGKNQFGNNFNPKYYNGKNFHSSPAPGILGTSPPRTQN